MRKKSRILRVLLNVPIDRTLYVCSIRILSLFHEDIFQDMMIFILFICIYLFLLLIDDLLFH